MGAGSAAEQIRQQTADGELTAKQAALAALIDPAHDPIGRTVTIRHTDGVNAFTVDA